MPSRSSWTGPSPMLSVSHVWADAAGVARESTLSLAGTVALAGAGELDSSPDCATGIAACVTIVRAAPDAGSVRFSVNTPTAATSPDVVCANLRIENDPVTCVIASATLPGVVDAGVVGDAVGGCCDGVMGSVGVVGVAGVANEPVMGILSLPDVG
jgi:hypothetical protein